jgi:hypothetical protein
LAAGRCKHDKTPFPPVKHCRLGNALKKERKRKRKIKSRKRIRSRRKRKIRIAATSRSERGSFYATGRIGSYSSSFSCS